MGRFRPDASHVAGGHFLPGPVLGPSGSNPSLRDDKKRQSPDSICSI